MDNIVVSVNGTPREEQRSYYKYYIDVSDRWNDYGFRTLCKLYRIMEDKHDIFIGYIRCFNYSGEIGSTFFHPSSSSRCFITEYKTAYKLILFTPKEDRLKLISELNIGLIFKSEVTEPIFTKSIMRGRDSEEFLKSNNDINRIIKTDVDVNGLLLSEKCIIESLFKSTEKANI